MAEAVADGLRAQRHFLVDAASLTGESQVLEMLQPLCRALARVEATKNMAVASKLSIANHCALAAGAMTALLWVTSEDPPRHVRDTLNAVPTYGERLQSQGPTHIEFTAAFTALLRDLGAADAQWQTACLRYFNPVGAHESGLIGEDPRGTPNNLMPYVAQVAVGRRERLSVYGDDYATPDGTGVRDYIHVTDLAEGHVAALRRLLDHSGSVTVNLGTGRGYSVLELVAAYEAASGRAIPYTIAPRRPGDIAACYADPALARQLLGWQARHELNRMCADSWRWQTNNPRGFDT